MRWFSCMWVSLVWALGGFTAWAEQPEESDSRGPAPLVFVFEDDTKLRLYGAIDVLTYYDTSSPAISDWLAFVHPTGTIPGDEDSFSMAVRASKIGITLRRPESLPGWDINAELEADFVGGFSTGATVAYSPLMRLKQSWVSLDSEHVSLLIGQTFGAFGPLFPSVGSWIALGTSGNPWIRLPQIRATIRYAPFSLVLSANRPMAANEVLGGSQDDIISDGERSNMPYFMGRLGYANQHGLLELATGVSAVYGRDKLLREDVDQGLSINTVLPVWLGVFDLELATRWVVFRGEAFIGANLSTFYGGIMQGVALDIPNNRAHAIRSMGGWAQLSILPAQRLYANIGAGIDKPVEADLLDGMRSSNLMTYANFVYRLSNDWSLALECSYLETDYKGAPANDNIRTMLRSTFSF